MHFQENALTFLQNNDEVQMRNLLAEICPVSDDSDQEKATNKVKFPLPETHWINLPYGPMYAAAWAMEKAGLLLRFQPPLHRRRLSIGSMPSRSRCSSISTGRWWS